jgi:hypothetical protein
MNKVSEIIAEACYENSVHVHNDPPCWNSGVPELDISEIEKLSYREDAQHIMDRLNKCGFKIVPLRGED